MTQQLSKQLGVTNFFKQIQGEDLAQEIKFYPCPGTDVMIAIFRDFCQFSAKKFAFTLKKLML
jgi:hypothetical protein